MAKKTSYSFGRLLMQIAFGVLLIVGGIWAFIAKGDFGCNAIVDHTGKIGIYLKYVYGLIEILTGFFLLIELITGDKFGKLDNIFMIILIVAWIIGIVFADFIGGIFKPTFLAWFWNFASHILIVGVMFNLKD